MHGLVCWQLMHGLPCTTTFRDVSSVAYRAQFVFLGADVLVDLPRRSSMVMLCMERKNSAGHWYVSKKLMIGLQQVAVAEVNTLIAHFFVSNFPFFHGRTRTSKLCNIVEVSLGKQQVTPEVQYLPQAGHLLQILQISYHSMKMRCEWLNMALLCSHVDIYYSIYVIQFCCAVAGEV